MAGRAPLHLPRRPRRQSPHGRSKWTTSTRTIWDVIGTVPGTEFPDEWVVAGNHRDAWVYGAVDPNSGTAAMLEAVHGLGVLLQQGWKPKRRIVFCSWDAEEEGLIGSTEWAEDHARPARPRRRLLQHRRRRLRPQFRRLRRALAQRIHPRRHQRSSQPQRRHRLRPVEEIPGRTSQPPQHHRR